MEEVRRVREVAVVQEQLDVLVVLVPVQVLDAARVETRAPTNNVGSGNIAGTVEAGDDPPVSKKKQKKQNWSGGRGARRQWMLKNASK